MENRILYYPVAKNIVCVEGCDFIGKTTFIKELIKYYSHQGIELLPLRHNNPPIKQIRELLLSFELPTITRECLFNAIESYLFSNDFNNKSKFILDRGWISRLVYQHALVNDTYSEGKVLSIVDRIVSSHIKIPYYNIILLSKNTETIENRIKSSGRELDIFEKMKASEINQEYKDFMPFLEGIGFEKIVKFFYFFVEDFTLSQLVQEVAKILDFSGENCESSAI